MIERKTDPKTGKRRYYVHYLECERLCTALLADTLGLARGGQGPATNCGAPRSAP